MRVAALCHFSMPFRCAGSETVVHELLKAAVDAGHEVLMVCTHKDALRNWTGSEPETMLDGVRILRTRNALMGGSLIRGWRPDVIVSHHDHASHAIKIAKLCRVRSVFLTHNDMALNARPIRANPTLVIHNSEWVRKSLTKQFGDRSQSMVFHPPLTPERHKVDHTGDAITLVNLNQHKGAELFYKLAETMPDRRFLGVVGGHGKQIIRRGLSNVTIMEHGPDMRRVWSQTRVLLMPSIYESYGLVAVEAGVNGIPTIANPTPGLLENLGSTGLFADRDDPDAWVEHIEALDYREIYEHESQAATQLAESAMSATRQTLNAWTDWLTSG